MDPEAIPFSTRSHFSPGKDPVPCLVITLLRPETSHYVPAALSDPTRRESTLCLICTTADTPRRFSLPTTIYTCGQCCIFFSLMYVTDFSLAFNLQSTLLTCILFFPSQVPSLLITLHHR